MAEMVKKCVFVVVVSGTECLVSLSHTAYPKHMQVPMYLSSLIAVGLVNSNKQIALATLPTPSQTVAF